MSLGWPPGATAPPLPRRHRTIRRWWRAKGPVMAHSDGVSRVFNLPLQRTGIPSPVDVRDQLRRTPLHVAAETHSARCIELLLSKNARTDLRLLEGRPLIPLEVALMSRRVQVQWSLDNSVEDLLSCLQERDLKAVRLLAEKTRVVGEVAYRCVMEGHVTALAMLLMVVEEKISAPVSVVIEGIRTKRSIYNSIVDEALSIGDVLARDGNERRKALLCEIHLLNQFGSALWRGHNIDRRTLPPLLRAAKVTC